MCIYVKNGVNVCVCLYRYVCLSVAAPQESIRRMQGRYGPSAHNPLLRHAYPWNHALSFLRRRSIPPSHQPTQIDPIRPIPAYAHPCFIFRRRPRARGDLPPTHKIHPPPIHTHQQLINRSILTPACPFTYIHIHLIFRRRPRAGGDLLRPAGRGAGLLAGRGGEARQDDAATVGYIMHGYIFSVDAFLCVDNIYVYGLIYLCVCECTLHSSPPPAHTSQPTTGYSPTSTKSSPPTNKPPPPPPPPRPRITGSRTRRSWCWGR